MARSFCVAMGLVLIAAVCEGGEVAGTGETARRTGASPDQTAGLPIDVQGHRGARGLKPENTLPAFEVALDLLVATLELDLHLTADGKVVVWHDPVIESTKCGLSSQAVEAVDPDVPVEDDRTLAISSMTLETVSQYRCDRNPDDERFSEQDNTPTVLAGDDFGIVELGRLFEFVDEYASSDQKSDAQRANAATVRFNIETKRLPDDPAAIGDDFDGTNPGRFEVEILDEVLRRDLLDRVTIQSFDHRSLGRRWLSSRTSRLVP